MWYVQTLPPMCPDDKLGLTLALYEAQTISASEAAQTILTLVGGEGAGLRSPRREPVTLELRSLLRGARGQELAAAEPARYQLLMAFCAGDRSAQQSNA